jgi:tRNA(Ile)-lysidine synthase
VEVVARIRQVITAELARGGLRRALVAYSGGPDSTVLADACAAAGDVVLLHVHHGAAASDATHAHAEAWARARGLELRVARVDVGDGASWEARARAARYRALVELAVTGEPVLTAHTASDQAETVLLQMVRGTGPAGLAGVARRRGPFLRPLLAVCRDDICAYVEAAGLDVWHDPMNTDDRFTRVRVRRDLIPMLRGVNPKIEAALGRLAEAAAEERLVIDGAATTVLRAAWRDGGLACATLAAAPSAVSKRALATWLRGRRGIAARHLDAVLALARGPDAGSRGVDLPGGRVERVYGELRLDAVRPGVAPLTIDGPDGPYRVRTWQPGDRMRPARLRGRSRKLSDLYIDRRVPRAARAVARVVEDAAGTIVWAEHVGIAHGASVTILPDQAAAGPRG